MTQPVATLPPVAQWDAHNRAQYRLLSGGAGPNNELVPDVHVVTLLHRELGRAASGHHRLGTVVDVGCGVGRYLPVLRPYAAQVVGVEPDAAFAVRAAATGAADTVLCCSLDDFVGAVGASVAPADAIVALACLQHVHPAAMSRVLAGLRARLAPGGTLIVTVPVPPAVSVGLIASTGPNGTLAHTVPTGQLAAALKGAGFAAVRGNQTAGTSGRWSVLVAC
jgi:predicted TPR repeat methyltransferase